MAGLARAVSEAVGTDVELERPADPQHGDYATNVALRLAGARRQAPRAVAEELAVSFGALDGSPRSRSQGLGSST